MFCKQDAFTYSCRPPWMTIQALQSEPTMSEWKLGLAETMCHCGLAEDVVSLRWATKMLEMQDSHNHSLGVWEATTYSPNHVIFNIHWACPNEGREFWRGFPQCNQCRRSSRDHQACLTPDDIITRGSCVASGTFSWGNKGYSNISNASAGNMTMHDHCLARATVPNAI